MTFLLNLVAKFLPSWFKPWMILVVIIAALGLALGVQTIRVASVEADLAEEQAAHAKTKEQDALALAEAVENARNTEKALRDDMDKLQVDAAKEKENAQAREAALVESVRTGARRLSVAAVCPNGAAGPGIRPPVASGGGAVVQRAELDPAAAERILRVVTDGDDYIRERNACVAAYETMRKRLNAAAQ